MNLNVSSYSILFWILFVIILMIGFKKGFLMQILDLCACFVSFYLSYKYCTYMSHLIPFLSLSILNTLLWFIILYIINKIIYSIIEHILVKLLHKTKLKTFDRILGGLVSLVKIVCICVVVFYICQMPFFSKGHEIIENTPLKYIGGILNEL
ncbi:CvpA family protein [Floccifex sp.]|uniref:CvpA family protein n=1 Tax=Floccifex sp. TaxID=2815810 RepID=UPI003F095034